MSTETPTDGGIKKSYYYDLAERAIWTFIETFLAVWLAPLIFNSDGINIWDYVTDTTVYQKAGIAGFAAAFSVVKGLMAKHIGVPNTAATLPVATVPVAIVEPLPTVDVEPADPDHKSEG
jgi:hypothetical protein